MSDMIHTFVAVVFGQYRVILDRDTLSFSVQWASAKDQMQRTQALSSMFYDTKIIWKREIPPIPSTSLHYQHFMNTIFCVASMINVCLTRETALNIRALTCKMSCAMHIKCRSTIMEQYANISNSLGLCERRMRR